MKIINYAFILLIKGYKHILSPHLNSHCRFTPTCSVYALQAFQKHHLFKALYLIIKRLLSCQPCGKHGYDPLP